MINILSILCEIVLMWMPLNLTDDKSSLVQVMAVRQQAITWASVGPDLHHHIVLVGQNFKETC